MPEKLGVLLTNFYGLLAFANWIIWRFWHDMNFASVVPTLGMHAVAQFHGVIRTHGSQNWPASCPVNLKMPGAVSRKVRTIIGRCLSLKFHSRKQSKQLNQICKWNLPFQQVKSYEILHFSKYSRVTKKTDSSWSPHLWIQVPRLQTDELRPRCFPGGRWLRLRHGWLG